MESLGHARPKTIIQDDHHGPGRTLLICSSGADRSSIATIWCDFAKDFFAKTPQFCKSSIRQCQFFR